MIKLNESRHIFLKIYAEPRLCDKMDSYVCEHKIKFNIMIRLCKLGRFEWFLGCDPFTKLCLTYCYLPITKSKYDKKGISKKIFYDTMDDIRIWIIDHKQRTNEDGLYEFNWIMLHLGLNIFKLGRLQFQKWFYYEKTPYCKNGKSIKLGDKVLNIHIPRGEKLDIDKCYASIEQARIFFKKYYPKYANNNFVCHSWLLYSENKNFMEKSSNIIKFSTLFDTVSQKQSPEQAILWLFGNKIKNSELMKHKEKYGTYLDTSILKANTPLQQRAIKYINEGGCLGDAFCVLK